MTWLGNPRTVDLNKYDVPLKNAIDLYLFSLFISVQCFFRHGTNYLVSMWSDIINAFSDSPSQLRVVRFLLENGFGVNESGKITANGIEMPATQVARAIGVDRRVIDTTARSILEHDTLKRIFCNIRVTPDLSRVAEALGLTIITLIPKNATDKHIVASAVSILDRYDLSIRQLFVTDPILSEEPKLVMIIEGALPHGVIGDLRNLPQVKRLIL